MTEAFPERMIARAQDLKKNEGLDWLLAHGIAWFEERILQWPSAWGDDLHVLIYGDFEAPPADLTYPSLGITVHCERKEKTIVRGAKTVLEATVKVKEKSVPALIDAARRINLLLDSCILTDDIHPLTCDDRLLLGKHIGKDIFHPLPELEALVCIQHQGLHECLGLLTTRFPNGFDGQAPFRR